MRIREKGNVLFLILIAIILFAALSYAVTSSTRSGTNNTSKEKDDLAASRLLNFATALQTGIMRLRTVNGVEITDLYFNNDVYKSINSSLLFPTMGTPSDPKLYVFHPLGGGVSPQTFVDFGVTCATCPGAAPAPGHSAMGWINIPDDGTPTADPAWYVHALNRGVCSALNAKLGIDIIPLLTVPTSGITFHGSSIPPAVTAATGSTPADLDAVRNRSLFCYQENNSNARYFFIQILQMN